MIEILLGIIIILHGIVFLLYAGHSKKLFELQKGMVWPNESWLLKNVIPENSLRLLTFLIFIIFAIMFVISGILFFIDNYLWKILIYIVSVISSIFMLLLWNGKNEKIADQGGVGLLINLFILMVLYFVY